MGQTRQTDPNVVSIGLARGRRAGGSLGGAVLLLEPQESDRLMVERVLTKAGMRVVSATDEDAGLDLVVDEDPRVIVASQALPSGIDSFIQLVKVMYAGRGGSPPIVVLVSDGQGGAGLGVEEAAGATVLRKPVDAQELVQAITEVDRAASVSRRAVVKEEEQVGDYLGELAAYESPEFIAAFVEATFQDIDKTVQQLEGLVFKPDADVIWQLIHALHGLGKNIGANELSSTCRRLLDSQRSELLVNYTAQLAFLKRLVERERQHHAKTQ